jgi:hypothetical protein
MTWSALKLTGARSKPSLVFYIPCLVQNLSIHLFELREVVTQRFRRTQKPPQPVLPISSIVGAHPFGLGVKHGYHFIPALFHALLA